MTQYTTRILANSEPLGLKVTRYYDWHPVESKEHFNQLMSIKTRSEVVQ